MGRNKEASNGALTQPLFWNPLPQAAEWLSEHTGRQTSPAQLIDAVAKMGNPGTPAPTIIKAVLPRGASIAVVRMFGAPEEMDSLRAQKAHGRVAEQHGDPCKRGTIAYVQRVFSEVAPLCANQLLDLLLRGSTDVALIHHGPGMWKQHDLSENDGVWLLPLGTAHLATIETCGINRDDLLELAGSMPTAETTEQRQERRHQACIDAKLKMPKDTYSRLPNGINKLAEREGIARQSFGEDVKAHIGRIYGR